MPVQAIPLDLLSQLQQSFSSGALCNSLDAQQARCATHCQQAAGPRALGSRVPAPVHASCCTLAQSERPDSLPARAGSVRLALSSRLQCHRHACRLAPLPSAAAAAEPARYRAPSPEHDAQRDHAQPPRAASRPPLRLLARTRARAGANAQPPSLQPHAAAAQGLPAARPAVQPAQQCRGHESVHQRGDSECPVGRPPRHCTTPCLSRLTTSDPQPARPLLV